MSLVLEVISGPLKGQRIEVGVDQIVRVGRTRKADVVLADNFLSGVHFALECDSKGCRLRDLNSRNGTKLNGELIIEAALKNGDQVFAGRTDFAVRFEDVAKPAISAEESISKISPVSAPGAKTPRKKRRVTVKIAPVEAPQGSPEIEGTRGPAIEMKEAQQAVTEPAPPLEKREPQATEREPDSSTPARASRAIELSPYESATPEGRLFHLLSDQPQQLMALIDAVRDKGALDLLRKAGVEYQSLYKSEQNAAISPYLVKLPPGSEPLKQMIQKGWGHEWGVYLTCPLSLLELRQYFRTALMVTMPDGMELFSRFYDPRFFRDFLEGCTAAEAEKFFGPVISYFMEDERPGILLQFTKSKTGTEKKGHLLSAL